MEPSTILTTVLYAAKWPGIFLGAYRGGVHCLFLDHTSSHPGTFSSTQVTFSATARDRLRIMRDTDTGSAYERTLFILKTLFVQTRASHSLIEFERFKNRFHPSIAESGFLYRPQAWNGTERGHLIRSSSLNHFFHSAFPGNFSGSGTAAFLAQ